GCGTCPEPNVVDMTHVQPYTRQRVEAERGPSRLLECVVSLEIPGESERGRIRGGGARSVGQNHFAEERQERVHLAVLLVVKLAEAVAGNERRGAHQHDRVVVQPRAPLDSATQVRADVAGDVALERERLQ